MIPHIRFSDWKQLWRPIGPLFAFTMPWILVLIGQSLALCEIIVEEFSGLYFIVLGNMITFVALTCLIQTFFPSPLSLDKQAFDKIEFSIQFRRMIFFLLFFYGLIQLFQIFFHKGFPLLWLLAGDKRSYSDYGIPSLNGLLNAIYLFGITGLYLMHLKQKSLGKLVLLSFFFLIPILMVCRQIFIAIFLQIACCTLIYEPKKIRGFTVAALAVMLLFCLTGNLRTGLVTLTDILGPKESIPTFFYPLLWIYAYVVTPFNNLNATFDQIVPVEMPFFELSMLVPSTLRNLLGAPPENTGFSLVNENMNVSTFYREPMLDFGPAWAFSLMTLFQFFLLLAFRRATYSKSPLQIIKYSIYYMIAVLSIFSNQLLYLPVISQLLLVQIAQWRMTRRNGVLVFQSSE